MPPYLTLPDPNGAQILLTLGSLAVAWLSLRKVIAPAWRGTKRVATRVGAALDTLGGRPPIIDRVTGEQLAPEQPPLGRVLADMKAELARVGDQSERLDRNEANTAALAGRVETVEQTVAAILADKWENGTEKAFKVVELRNKGAIDAEEE